MSAVISAIYEGGVFKPIGHVHLKEHQPVELMINPINSVKWESEFKALLESIHRHTAKFSSTEIEDDITLASKEVKEEHRVQIGLS